LIRLRFENLDKKPKILPRNRPFKSKQAWDLHPFPSEIKTLMMAKCVDFLLVSFGTASAARSQQYEANGKEFGETDKEVTKTGHYLCRKAGKKSDAGQIIGEHQLV